MAAAPGLTASLDRELVPVGETVTLTLAFEDVSPQGVPNLPPVPNLTVLATGRSSQFSMFNGQRTTRELYTYTLQANAVGDVTIPSLQVLASGRLVTSQPLKLKVVQQDPNVAAAMAQTAFLKLMIGKNELYLGEALPVEITLYVQEGRDATMPQLEAQGFTVGKVVQNQQTRAQVGNQIYNVLPFRTYVAPARAGQLNLGPATMTLFIPRPNARRSIFGIEDWQRVTLTAEAQSINVLSLPAENVPEQFNGAVGTYAMQVTVGPTNLAVGDPITVKVQISGRGLLDALALPPQSQWRDFTAYAPSSTVESGDPHVLSGVKKFEQVLIPQNHEIKTLPPFVFSFFDPQQKQYRTLSGPAVALNIRPTASAAPPLLTNAAGGPREEPAPDDIIHIKPRAEAIAMARPPLIQQPVFIAFQAVPILAWVALAVARRRREFLVNNPRVRRQREVAQRVQRGLQELHQLAQAQQAEGFFALLFRLLQEQIGARLDLPASSITEAIIDERLSGRGLPTETLERLRQLFRTCDQARYAPYRTTQELESLIPITRQTLAELQQVNV